ncbi:MAG: ISL3 family transposase [Actinomycetota bacterium]|jgi:transposase|nr:ISL3 family transposase [Actinomycetota bacterium]MDQ3378233.1 ISL3 family transposase [Actinomycetota bacterium]MDQ3436222.1 ISL3 family transposase [Actinomycetota bacterium]
MPNADPYSGSFTVPDRLHVDLISFDGDLVTIHASTEGPAAECPLCERPSRRLHGSYTRTLADLPWCGTPVRLRVRVRKFFCDEPSCERKIFAERLGEVARPSARGTDRRREALEWIAFALGGEAGARLARELGLLVSPDTLLNRIRGAFRAEAEDVRVLGVDDFGFRKGNAPGTILVDLERHEVADLFEGHSAESIARWLGRHPGVEVVARDRSHVCREGINAGAPDALQVADRWHLLRSLALGLEEFLLHKRSALGRAAATGTDDEEERLPGSIDEDVSTLPVRLGRPYGSVEGPAQKRHERLVQRWEEIRKLHLRGASVKDIAEWVGTSQSTVYRYRERTEPPPRPGYKRRASVLDPYLPYLLGRWNEGCRSAKRLHREIREMGYRHSIDTVNRLLSSFRYTEQQGEKIPLAPRAKTGSIAGASPTAKNVAALFMRREEKLNAEQKEYLDRLCASDRALADARRLTQEFAKTVRNLEGEKLDGWLEEAAGCEAQVVRKFAASLKKDLAAVRAGLTEEWSTGPVEGFITKLKLLKRQGYGRANFDLLRARALAA